MVSRRIRFLAPAVAAVAAGMLSLTACGDNASSSSGSHDSGSSGTNASYHALSADDWASTVTQAAKLSKNSHLEMTIGSVMTGSGDMSMINGKPAMNMSMKMSVQGRSMNMKERVVDGTMYMTMPGTIPAGKWIRLDAKTPGLGKIAGMLKNYDPTSMAAISKDAIKSFKYDGDTKIDGDSVHHYTVVVDVAKAADKLGFGSMLSQTGASMPSSMTEEVYLNSNNTLRRVAGDISGQKMQVDRTDASGPVKVTAPPSKDVVDMSTMMSQMSKGGASS